MKSRNSCVRNRAHRNVRVIPTAATGQGDVMRGEDIVVHYDGARPAAAHHDARAVQAARLRQLVCHRAREGTPRQAYVGGPPRVSRARASHARNSHIERKRTNEKIVGGSTTRYKCICLFLVHVHTRHV